MKNVVKLYILARRTKTAALFAVFVAMLLVSAFVFNRGVAAQNNSCGMLAYDWNGPVTTAERGFPREQPPRNNFDWTQPVDYAGGTLYYRAEILGQPAPQEMRLQLCFWQPQTPSAEYKFGNENCGPQEDVTGNRGAVIEWQKKVDDMWKLGGRDIDWTRDRYRTAVAVKNSAGEPVSNYNGWDWNGENPSLWYPLNMRFTTVVVPSGGEFCGWSYYLTPTAVTLQEIRAGGGNASLLGAALLALAALVAATALMLHKRSRLGA